MKYFFYLALCTIFVCYAPGVEADALSHLTQQLEKFHSLSARFSQQVMNAKGQVQYQVSGQLYLKKPNGFYWETQGKLPQKIVLNGQKLSIYDPDLQQVTVSTLTPAYMATPALLLTGTLANIADAYEVIQLERPNEIVIFELIPRVKPHPAFRKLSFAFQKERLVGMKFWDHLGQTTQIDFSEVKLNPALASRQFVFVPPKGVEVIENVIEP